MNVLDLHDSTLDFDSHEKINQLEQVSLVINATKEVVYFNKSAPQWVDKYTIPMPITELEIFNSDLSKINALLDNIFDNNLAQEHTLILFSGNEQVQAYEAIFKPVIHEDKVRVAYVSVAIETYNEKNLLRTRLSDLNYTKSNMSYNFHERATNYTAIVSRLSQLHLAICYLISHRYTNEEIADVLNLVDKKDPPYTRSAINRQVEHMKAAFDTNSKDELIELLVFLKIHNQIPKLIYTTSN